MAQIEAPDDDNTNPLTGNIPVSKAGDVNTILRSLMKRRRITRVDLLGRTQDHTDE